MLPPTEIRVKRKVGIGRYLKRAADLLNDPENKTVVIKGVSNAVESAVKLAELIKHRFAGLHQLNKIHNLKIVDEYEPLEEGLDYLKFPRIVTMLEITLSKDKLAEGLGYQSPIDESLVIPFSERLENLPKERTRSKSSRGRRGGKETTKDRTDE